MKTLTLAGHVWLTTDHGDRSILMLGSHPRSVARDAADLITQSIYFDNATDPALVARDAHILVTFEYQDRAGMLPVLTAQKIEPFEERETDAWRRYY